MKKNKQTGNGGKPLSIRERCIIEVRWRDGKSITAIADELGRHKSSISRDLKGYARRGVGAYRGDVVHKKACTRIENRGNVAKLTRHTALATYVTAKLKIGWSPEQIAIRLPLDHPDDAQMGISYEAVYQYVYAQIHRGGNGRVKAGCEDLRPYLARRHTRRATKGFRKAQKAERNASLPSIENRPAEADARTVVGHWEGDTLVSKQSKPRVKSLNERLSGVVFFGRTKDGTAAACDAVILKRLGAIPSPYRKTLTQDRGTENIQYAAVESALGINCYFAHAYASYERGSNENTNGLLRRYFPKKTDWSTVSDADIARAEYLINTRPRKRHGGLTPYEVFYQKTGVALFP